MPTPEWIENLSMSVERFDYYDGLDLIDALKIAVQALESEKGHYRIKK